MGYGLEGTNDLLSRKIAIGRGRSDENCRKVKKGKRVLDTQGAAMRTAAGDALISLG
jgi:hypothetical protein